MAHLKPPLVFGFLQADPVLVRAPQRLRGVSLLGVEVAPGMERSSCRLVFPIRPPGVKAADLSEGPGQQNQIISNFNDFTMPQTVEYPRASPQGEIQIAFTLFRGTLRIGSENESDLIQTYEVGK